MDANRRCGGVKKVIVDKIERASESISVISTKCFSCRNTKRLFLNALLFYFLGVRIQITTNKKQKAWNQLSGRLRAFTSLYRNNDTRAKALYIDNNKAKKKMLLNLWLFVKKNRQKVIIVILIEHKGADSLLCELIVSVIFRYFVRHAIILNRVCIIKIFIISPVCAHSDNVILRFALREIKQSNHNN